MRRKSQKNTRSSTWLELGSLGSHGLPIAQVAINLDVLVIIKLFMNFS